MARLSLHPSSRGRLVPKREGGQGVQGQRNKAQQALDGRPEQKPPVPAQHVWTIGIVQVSHRQNSVAVRDVTSAVRPAEIRSQHCPCKPTSSENYFTSLLSFPHQKTLPLM